MQRFIVGQHGWLTDAQFSASVALAQAAPGPNVLFVAVLGFNVAGVVGALVTLVGTLLPSTLLTLQASRWGERRRDSRALRAFTAGLAPLTLGLLMATGWILFEPAADRAARWGSALLALATIAIMLRTRWSPLVPITIGAVAGALGWAG
jgi:chromate transporter